MPTGLPPIAGVAESPDEKLALVRAWIHCWRRYGFWLNGMPQGWWLNEVRAHANGKFDASRKLLPNKGTKSIFEKTWVPQLLSLLAEPVPGNKYKLLGKRLSLHIGG